MSVQEVRLAEVAEINPSRQKFEFADADAVTFIPMEAVSEEGGVVAVPMERPYLKVKRGYTVFVKGDVIFAKITPCMQNGKHAIIQNLISGVGFGSTEFHVVRPGMKILSEWIHYFLRRTETLDAAIRTFTGTVGQQRVPSSFLEELVIPLPPVEQQRRVTAELTHQLRAVRNARDAAKAQLDDARRLVPAILAETFAETVDADFVKIGEVARTTSGTTPSRGRKDYWDPPKHPWVKTGEVAFKPISQTEELISDRALAECSLSLLPPGTVLIAMYGQGKTRGQSALLEVAATTNQACFAILPNDHLDPEYLQFWLRHSYQVLRAQSEARGGNQSNLNGAMLNNFEVPLLPRPRQEAIAKRIKVALAEAEILQALLSKQLNDIEQMEPRLLSQTFNQLNHQAPDHG